MSEANQRTLHTYNNGVEAYIDGTPQVVRAEQKRWIDMALSDVDSAAKILEIGSAFGRDAKYLMEQGYDVTLTDATQAFVDYLKGEGYDASLLDIVTERPNELYDAIFASAVFLHFTNEDFAAAVANVRSALKDDGKFVFSLKNGDGETWSTVKMDAERYFHYWRRDALEQSLGALGMSVADDQSFEDDGWLYMVARKTGATS